MQLETEKEVDKKIESFWNASLLKILGITYTIAAPWFIWITLQVFYLHSEVSLLKQKMEIVSEFKNDLKEIRQDINQIKIDIAMIKK